MLNMMSAAILPPPRGHSPEGQDCLGFTLRGGRALSHHQRRIPGLAREMV